MGAYVGAAMADTLRDLTHKADALKQAGRLDDAIALFRKITTIWPASAIAEHNLASALGEAGLWREADHHIQLAFKKGGDHPATWLVSARCQLMLSQPGHAERALKEALKREPLHYDAHRELAQLRWMKSADAAAALEELDQTLRSLGRDARLLLLRAQILEFAGDRENAWGMLKDLSQEFPDDIAILNQAAQAATERGEDGKALALSEHCVALSPGELIPLITLISANLAAGRADVASRLTETARKWSPENQHAIALQATAWRLLGDPRYEQLYNYGDFVRPFWIDTPSGWPSREAYLSDLAKALVDTHEFTTHPFNQSIRKGAQAPDILHRDHPTFRALTEALGGPIRRYIEALGVGEDPLRARNRGGYEWQGLWSIRMQAGGFHINHVHPNGWISSACYVQTPKTMVGREGWLQFGQPGIRTSPQVEAEHFVAPEPGKLVLFPSYMWHGTAPYTDPSPRMTVAFDLVPG